MEELSTQKYGRKYLSTMTGCLVVKFPPPDRKEVNLMFVLGHY
jgi:hypothetical protein